MTLNLKTLNRQTETVAFMPYHSFEDLDVWKRACRLATAVYEALRDCRDLDSEIK